MSTAEELKARIAALTEEIKARKTERRAARQELVALALQALPPERRPQFPVMGTWECEPHPEAAPASKAHEVRDEDYDTPDTANAAGLCIYDEEEDPCHDFCLFCGQPEERK